MLFHFIIYGVVVINGSLYSGFISIMESCLTAASRTVDIYTFIGGILTANNSRAQTHINFDKEYPLPNGNKMATSHVHKFMLCIKKAIIACSCTNRKHSRSEMKHFQSKIFNCWEG